MRGARDSTGRLAVQFCGLTPAEAAEAIDRAAEGVSKTRAELIARTAGAGSEEAESILKAMLQTWEDGLAKTRAGNLPHPSPGLENSLAGETQK